MTVKQHLVVAGIVVLASIITINRLNSLQDENERLHENVTTLTLKNDTLRTKSGRAMSDCGRLQLTIEELEAQRADLAKDLEDMQVKLKRATAAAKTGIATTIEVQTTVRDTIVVRDTAEIKGRAFEWRDQWTDVRGVVTPADAALQIESRDTLTMVVYRVPKRWLFFKWGTKAVRCKVASRNPHTKIECQEYIEISK